MNGQPWPERTTLARVGGALKRAFRMVLNKRGALGDGTNPTLDAEHKTLVDAAVKEAQTNWVSGLEPSAQEVVKLKGWKSPAEVVKSYVEIEQTMGRDKIAMPLKDKDGNFDPQGVRGVLDRLGVPKDPKEYSFDKEAQIAEGSGLRTDQLEAFKPIAHKYGLLPSQFKGIMSEFVKIVNLGHDSLTKERTEKYNTAVAALRQKWGLAYESKAALANQVLKMFGGKDLGAEVAQKYANDPHVIELLATIGEGLSEEQLQKTNMSSAVLTPAEAKAKLDEVNSHVNDAVKHPYFDAAHKDHKFWVDEVAKWTKLAFPNG